MTPRAFALRVCQGASAGITGGLRGHASVDDAALAAVGLADVCNDAAYMSRIAAALQAWVDDVAAVASLERCDY